MSFREHDDVSVTEQVKNFSVMIVKEEVGYCYGRQSSLVVCAVY